MSDWLDRNVIPAFARVAFAFAIIKLAQHPHPTDMDGVYVLMLVLGSFLGWPR